MLVLQKIPVINLGVGSHVSPPADASTNLVRVTVDEVKCCETCSRVIKKEEIATNEMRELTRIRKTALSNMNWIAIS